MYFSGLVYVAREVYCSRSYLQGWWQLQDKRVYLFIDWQLVMFQPSRSATALSTWIFYVFAFSLNLFNPNGSSQLEHSEFIYCLIPRLSCFINAHPPVQCLTPLLVLTYPNTRLRVFWTATPRCSCPLDGVHSARGGGARPRRKLRAYPRVGQLARRQDGDRAPFRGQPLRHPPSAAFRRRLVLVARHALPAHQRYHISNLHHITVQYTSRGTG